MILKRQAIADLIRTTPLTARWLVAAVFASIIAILSLTPDDYQAGDGAFRWLVTNTLTPIQKLLHVAVYAVLAILLSWSLQGVTSPRLRLLLVCTLAVVFGAVLEWLQLFVPGRFGTLYDILLNAAGAVLGAAIARLFG